MPDHIAQVELENKAITKISCKSDRDLRSTSQHHYVGKVSQRSWLYECLSCYFPQASTWLKRSSFFAATRHKVMVGEGESVTANAAAPLSKVVS